MKYYIRRVCVKDYQGRFHKAVYTTQTEYFKTNDEEVLKNFNKGKKIKFEEINPSNLIDNEIRIQLRKKESNKLYTFTDQLSDKEIHFRPRISKRW